MPGRTVRRPWLIAGALPAALAVFLLRHALWALAVQAAAAWLLMGLALPLARGLEKRFRPGTAAALAFAMLAAAAVTVCLLLLPPLFRQFGQLSDLLPALLSLGEKTLSRLEALLSRRGIDAAPLRDHLLAQAQQALGSAVAFLADRARMLTGSVSRLFLSPLFAYYLLRDRRRISAALTRLFPVACRARAVRAAREMRRETVGFLRGQLLLSAFVGTLTALGLLLVGTPGWLALGLLMGLFELIPYIGPFIAAVPAVLFALQQGWGAALWTLGVIIAVQQVEGTFLSPRLLSGATRLHPLAVLTAISAGSLLGGPWGMLLALPAVVSARGAVRGWRN